MPTDRIVATYWIETPLALQQAAEALAGEQSTGTFVRVPGETEELRERFGARVEQITPLAEVEAPSLPGSRADRRSNRAEVADKTSARPKYRQAQITVSFPLESLGSSLTTLIATVAGNLFELSEFSGLKLLDLDLPAVFGRAYPGPQFGIEGTRRSCGVQGRPIIGTIIKPSVGLAPEQTAQLVQTLAEAGIDFVKDDELMANPPHSPFERRVEAVMRVINENADRTGKKIMYAFNISDDLDAMLRHHDVVLAAGGTCVMVSVNSVGVTGVEHLRRRCALPIHAHRNGWGMYTRCPALGIAFITYQKLWRLAGVDHLHVNGLQNKFWEPDVSVIQSALACLTPLLGGKPVMPVLSSGQWGGQAPETYRLLGSVDLMYLAGGGIMAHPGGPAAGVRGIQQAWEAAVEGIPLERYALDRAELRQTLEKFGKA